MKEKVRSIAAAGNAAALVLLIFILANRGILFEEAPSPALPRSAGEGVLLIVIDGLRLDRSLDPHLMPNLVRLGQEGSRGIARVEALIPSTIAGIRTLAEGIVPPPASFFGDFGTTRSPTGGIFAAARKAGLDTFVAGPRLWSDLYGPWLTGSLSVETVSGRDGLVLQAGLAALRSGRYSLTVIHLNGPDDAAHLAGARSPEYERALSQADAAVGQLIQAAGPRTRIVVTADHGVTDTGGHAGPEEEVIAVPVVARGLDLKGEIRQRDLLGAAPMPNEPGPRGSLLTAILGLTAAVAVGSVLQKRSESPRAATWLNAILWIALAAAVAGLPLLSLLLAFGALTATARPFRLSPFCLGTTAAGLAVGLLRILDGETASLSTLDVRAAFRIVDGPLGLAGAATIAALRQALPALLVVLVLVPFLRRADPDRTAAFAAGLLTFLAGQAAAGALVLLSEDFAFASRSFGLLVRLIGELSALFLGCALAVFIPRRDGSGSP